MYDTAAKRKRLPFMYSFQPEKWYSQISVIRTSIIRNYWVIRRRWTVLTFFPIIFCNKLPIIRISIIRKIQFFEVIRRSRLKKMLLNHPSRLEVQMSRMVIMISLFGRVRFTHLSDLENKVETGNCHRINAMNRYRK